VATTSGPDVDSRRADGDEIVEQGYADSRRRLRRMAGPCAALVGTGIALGYLAVVDPNQPGHYPVCPTRALLGIDCPGCGMMRATHDLVTGNVAGALDHNVLIVVLAPLVAWLWARWAYRSWTGRHPAVTRDQFRRRNLLMIGGLVALLAFGVVRNFVPYLGSGLS
jgi:hypothetical protein